MGFFAPLNDDSELYELLKQAGVRKIREIGRCKTYEEFQEMAEANFNLVLNPEARFAAEDLQYKLGIPSVELTRLYQIDRIERQYTAFGQALGVTFETEKYRKEAEEAVLQFRKAYPDTVFAVGEAMNGNPFELALALTRYGFKVAEIYGTIAPEFYVYVNKLAQISPETKIYSNLEPTMLYYSCSTSQADMTIGKDAGYYHPDCPNLQWNSDVQPFGYQAVRDLFRALFQAKQGEEENR
jgi:nitrogenase molybdenum-cofactor synthesis protein NifE